MVTSDDADGRRAATLRRFGAGGDSLRELLDYGAGAIDLHDLQPVRVPREDEPHVAAWRGYCEQAAGEPLLDVLRRALVQLHFPLREGISTSDAYKAATLRGADPDLLPDASGLELQDPAGLQLRLHPTPGGVVPVLVPCGRADFESLVRALTARNEPVDVPPSMGAATVVGYNNWGRVRERRSRWLRDNPGGDWAAEFQRMLAHKELYQDRFLIISDGVYSAVPAAAFELDDESWRRTSITIRTAHEGTHYTMQRLLGTTRNRMHDELIADYAGIVAAIGRYRAEWFLRFVGLEDLPRYREGGRLQNYRGAPPLSDEAFVVLQRVVAAAAVNLETFDATLGRRGGARETAVTTVAIAATGLEAIAAPDGPQRLALAARHAERLISPA